MPYILQIKDLTEYEGKAFLNSKGNAECVEFVRQTLGLPPTLRWKEGKKITKGDSTILKGTAIATFVNGVYPQEGNSGKHAAIYLGYDEVGLIVLDQWRGQGMVKKRTIRWKPTNPGISNDGNAFSVIETFEPSKGG